MSWKTMSKRETGSSASGFLCSNNNLQGYNAKDKNIYRVIGKFITTNRTGIIDYPNWCCIRK